MAAKTTDSHGDANYNALNGRHIVSDAYSKLAPLAIRGFEELRRATRFAANKHQDSPINALLAIGMAYIAFAVQYPREYRLMFGLTCIEEKNYPELAQASAEAYRVLNQTIGSGISSGRLRSAPAEMLSLASWAFVHGLATLSIDRPSGPIQLLDNPHTTRQILALFLNGISADKIDREEGPCHGTGKNA